MKEQVKKLLLTKKIVINEYLIKVATLNKLSLNEFLVLVYLDNNYSDHFDLELMSKNLGLDENITMEAFNGLMLKGLVSLDSVKDQLARYNEIVNMDNLYMMIAEIIDAESNDEVKDDIFKIFERELGRTISTFELEMINAWLDSGTSEELILGALKEAIYNGVNNFRYIDRIIFEWEKNGFKNMDDVNNHLKNRRAEKSKDKTVSKKEQEILDFDWVNND